MFLDRLKQKFKKPKTVISLQIDTHKCVGCGKCAKWCKRRVFTMDSENKVAVVSTIAACVGCGKCVDKMCKFNAISLKTN